ncbi:hypothetical protein HDU87_000226 [Geranomyces variabilis]|uniref:Uncharacterized protein n=1 Tax=Geranomyces variabilis TaxID=109894 RepID=A0AAD5TUE3_9FUNG|nr:hypothetical protein HDU87_000226 [Geranomyces variabilis]
MRNSPTAVVGARPHASSSPRKKTGHISALSSELVNTYKVAPFVPTRPRSSPSSARTARSAHSSSSAATTTTATCFREPEALQQDLHTARAQINELVYERKVLKTKTCALEEELRKMDARYEELLSINTIRNLRLALKNLTRRSKEQEKEIAELKESTRFNKLYLKEQECIALFQETLKLRHALSNTRTATTPTMAKPEAEAELDALQHKLAAEEQERKLLEGTCRKLQSDNAALTTQLGEAESKRRLSQLVLDEAEHRWRSDGERERTALRSTIQELETRLERMKIEHGETESERRDADTKLMRELTNVWTELDAKKQAAAKLEGKVKELERLLEISGRRGDELEVQLGSWRTEVEELVSALESAQEQLSERQRQRDERAHSDTSEVDQLKSALATAKIQLDEHIRRAEAERAKQAQEAEDAARALAHAESQVEEHQRQHEETSQIRANEVNEAASLSQQSDKYRQDLEEMRQRNEELETLVKTLRTAAAAEESTTTYSPKRSASVQSLKNVVVTNTSSPPLPPPPSSSSSSSSRSGSRSRVNVSVPVKKATATATAAAAQEEALPHNADDPPPAPAAVPPPQEDDFRVHHLSRAVSTEFFEKQVQVDAAIAIQAAARGYLVRRSLPPAYKRRRHAPTPSIALEPADA